MRIRVRGPSGQTTVTLPDKCTVGELKSQISDATGLEAFSIKTGVPPHALEPLILDGYADSTTLEDASLKLANAMLIISSQESPATPSTPLVATTPSHAPNSATQSQSQSQSSRLLALERKKQKETLDPPELDVPEWGLSLVLRVMEDDNSCLFRALGTCVLSEEIDSATELRDVVAATIQGNPAEYSEAILGRAPDKYCAKIKDPDAWGGEIEIRIIAEVFGIGVDAIDVETQHIYSYNQDATTRCIIIYSGIHYDTVALSGPGVPDIKQFPVSEYAPIREKAVQICSILKDRHYFTNTSTFSIKCEKCGWKGAGERDAQIHNSQTGHFDFSEA